MKWVHPLPCMKWNSIPQKSGDRNGYYGNIQLVKHTDDLDPDVSEGENTDDPNAGIIDARKQAQSLKFT